MDSDSDSSLNTRLLKTCHRRILYSTDGGNGEAEPTLEIVDEDRNGMEMQREEGESPSEPPCSEHDSDNPFEPQTPARRISARQSVTLCEWQTSQQSGHSPSPEASGRLGNKLPAREGRQPVEIGR